MKFRLILLVLAILAIEIAEAKNQKIKYGKCVYYEGEVVNKQPDGIGSLVLVSPSDKNNIETKIFGRFDNTDIANVKIVSTSLPNLTSGNIVFNTIGKMGKIENLTFKFPTISFSHDGALFETGELNATLSIANKMWKMDLVPDKQFIAKSTTYPVPSTITEYWPKPTFIETSFTLQDGKFKKIHEAPFIYNYGTYCYSTDTNLFCYIADDNRFQGTTFIIDRDTWSGTRVFADGTIITGDQNGVTVNSDKGVFQGSLIDPMQPVQQSVGTFGDLKFNNGTLKNAGYSVKYINGESEAALRERLAEKKMDSDLIDNVVSGIISENEAAVKQQERLEEIARKEEQAKIQALASILKSKWNCKEILFSGTITGTEEGDNVFQMIFNIDHTYFTGKAMLALDADGQAAFVVIVEPSSKVYNMSRGRQMQVIDACKKLYKNISGSWDIVGNNILINGDKIAILSKDGKKAIYEGMVGATMTIEKRQ